MFISSSTSAAAGSGTSRSNASVTAQTASSCSVQPTICRTTAATAAPGARSTASPCRAIASSLRAVREPCGEPPWARRADSIATREQAEPDEAEDHEARDRPVRELRRQQRRRATSSEIGKRSNSRWANTVPSSVALVPRPCGRCRRSTATRASSPARAGSTAFPSSPTPKAEKTLANRGSGGGSAWWIVRCHAQRAREHREEVERDADDDPAPADEVERVVDGVPVRPAPPERARSRRRARRARPRPRAQGLRESLPSRVTRRRLPLVGSPTTRS